jgi:hypothetical protein
VPFFSPFNLINNIACRLTKMAKTMSLVLLKQEVFPLTKIFLRVRASFQKERQDMVYGIIFEVRRRVAPEKKDGRNKTNSDVVLR